MEQETRTARDAGAPVKIGAEAVRAAAEVLRRYRAGKQNLDRRIIDNEQFWKLRHWEQMEKAGEGGNPADPQPASGWLVNCILSKHADAMDSYPEPTVLPREPDDREEAEKLTRILPVILQNNRFKKEYARAWWNKLKSGCAVYGVFWDNEKLHGLGDVSIRSMDVLNLFWEPGVTDIQESEHFFCTELVPNNHLVRRWPELEGKLGRGGAQVSRYLFDDKVDTSEQSLVVDWYYHTEREGRQVLQYCKFVGETVLYATENENGEGWYDHGKYPFVFDPLFMEEDSPAGFGYIDVMKECQTAIDRMNHAMDENVLLASKQRYVLSDTAGVNEEELADLSRDIVHVAGRLGDESFRPLQTAGLQGNSLSYRNSRIEELKEISGNRDMTQGGTAGGVTAASAIAALQEAGSKLSRDMLKSAYRAFARECYLIIDLMRQFYDEERVFRVIGPAGGREFVPFSGAALRARPMGLMGGVELGSREPVFDIVVSAEKKSTFSRLSQNETAKECYQLGFFAPANADAALAALEMMDFEGIEKVRQRVRQNGTLAQQLAQMQAQMAQLTGLLEVQKKSKAPKLSGPAQELSTAAMARAMKTQKGEMR